MAGVSKLYLSVMQKHSKYKTIFPLSQLPKYVVVAVIRRFFIFNINQLKTKNDTK